MSLTDVDRIIAREVGELCFDLLPDMYPGLEQNEKRRSYRNTWGDSEPDELRFTRNENPVVEYPVIYLGSDVLAAHSSAPFLYPPQYGEALHLSEYLPPLRRFLTFQLITGDADVPLLWRTVTNVAEQMSTDEVLHFVDELWRGRWIVSADKCADLRRFVIAGGTAEALESLGGNVEVLETEALRLIKQERRLKDTAQSTEEWLHEAYCFLPDVKTWFWPIRKASRDLKSDELEKYDRVLDEFKADILTTLSLTCGSFAPEESLADVYALKPLAESRTVDEAIDTIRGVYRGRTIIPRVWYEKAKNILDRLKLTGWQPAGPREALHHPGTNPLSAADYRALNDCDLAQSFGRVMTATERAQDWILLGELFDYWDEDERSSDKL